MLTKINNNLLKELRTTKTGIKHLEHLFLSPMKGTVEDLFAGKIHNRKR